MHLARSNIQPRAAAALMLTLATLACGPDRRARLSVGIQAADDYASPGQLSAYVVQGGTGRVLDAGTMAYHKASPGRYNADSGPIDLAPGKEVTVAFFIGATGGSPTEVMTFKPEADYEYGVVAVVDTLRPVGLCVNLQSVHPLPAIGAGPADTLFVIMGGLPRGAVC